MPALAIRLGSALSNDETALEFGIAALPFASGLENCYCGSRRGFYEAAPTCDLDQGDVPHSPTPANAGQVYRGHAELPPPGVEVLRLGVQRTDHQSGDAR